MKYIAILTSGLSRGSNFSAIVEYFKSYNLPVVVSFIVVTKKDAPVIEKAQSYGIEVVLLKTMEMASYEEQLLAKCRESKIDLIALAGFLKQLSPEFIDNFGKPILNIHPALLPKYGGKGMYGESVHKAVFAAKEDCSGVTIHYVNENYDDGDIVIQKRISIEDCRNPQEIAQKVLKLEHKLYAPAIWQVLNE